MTAKRSTARKTKGRKPGSSLTLREQNRTNGYKLLRQGCTKAQVAKTLGVSWGTANRWTKQLKTRHTRQRDRKRCGRPSKLTSSQRAKLKNMLIIVDFHQGTRWRIRRVAEVIEEEFNVKYSVSQVWRVLRSLGF